ncbi:hypothetical protein Syun_026465 [Stephania yunnanensis]|uniref:Uncharacterized protein n=1 Tax=Stephania yunnanensis TaxID=152371 RepID=A0AAP0HX16_9MAGN
MGPFYFRKRKLVVGIKPTIGLTSRSASFQFRLDKILSEPFRMRWRYLDAIVGFDWKDAAATREASKFIPYGGYKQFLKPYGVKGKRQGVVRNPFSSFPSDSTVIQAFESHLHTLRQSGAILVNNLEINEINTILNATHSGEALALVAEFKLALNAYLKDLIISPIRLDSRAALNHKYINQQGLFVECHLLFNGGWGLNHCPVLKSISAFQLRQSEGSLLSPSPSKPTQDLVLPQNSAKAEKGAIVLEKNSNVGCNATNTLVTLPRHLWLAILFEKDNEGKNMEGRLFLIGPSTDFTDREKGKYILIKDDDHQLGLFDKPLPCCGCGIGWFSFLLGFVFPLMWYYATILYFGNYYRKDPRERAGLAASAIAVSIDMFDRTVDHITLSSTLVFPS